MHKRIYSFLDDFNLLYKLQFGFRSKYSTSHALIHMTESIRAALDSGFVTCGIFVDFQKAFDSVWHDGLFRKLENLGINGNFLNLIRDIYKQTKCAVKINNKTTQFFNYNKGVLQGNPLSPILFNIFINEIFKKVQNTNSMLTLDGTNYFNALMYADDLILLSTTEEGLQNSLDSLYEFCNTWKLNINGQDVISQVFGLSPMK